MRTSDTRNQRFLRWGFLLVLALSWVTMSGGPVVHAWECGDNVCDTDEGENNFNCSADCEPVCGNDACEDGETCRLCPEDCSDQCICGDQYCDVPYEFGGSGSGNEPECENPQVDDCSYCPSDCGGCNPWLCDPQVCADAYGQCRPCESTQECFFSDEYCDDWLDTCIIGTNCTDTFDCFVELGPGWSCDTSQNPGICVPDH